MTLPAPQAPPATAVVLVSLLLVLLGLM